MNKHRHPLKAFVLGAIYALFASTPVVAEDTEIFFGGTTSSDAIQPNVLFMLDTSGSMDSTDGTGQSRLERMKVAMRTIVENTNNVRIGLGRFTSPGGAIIYPLDSIDAVADGGSVTSKISANGADGWEYDSSIDLGYFLPMGVWSDIPTYVALQFTDLDLPQGVTVTSASLSMSAAGDYSSAQVEIYGEKSTNAATLTTSSSDISGRTPTDNSVVWNTGDWTYNETYQSSDFGHVVEEIVADEDWCGGNTMTIILKGVAGQTWAWDHDNYASAAPTLNISFEPDSIPESGGCQQKEYSSRISSTNDDAEMRTNNGDMKRSSGDLDITIGGSRTYQIGLRFPNMSLPADAQILSAYVEFVADESDGGSADYTIYGENSADSSQFSNSDWDISSRSRTLNSVDWDSSSTPPTTDWYQDDIYVTPDLSTIVQEQVNLGNWDEDSAVTFIIEGSGERAAESYDGSPAEAPRLVVVARTEGTGEGSEAIKTVRDELLEVIDTMEARSSTPIVGSLYESARYFRGDSVLWGASRGSSSRSYKRVSHPDSYTGGAPTPANCTGITSDSCSGETISGSPVYISPINETCQRNYVVLLSDGEPTYNQSVSYIEDLIGGSCAVQGYNGTGTCGPELAEFMAGTDQSSLSGTQNIITHTIGFNILESGASFLQDIALSGGGSYYSAESADELVDAFDTIIKSILKTDATFVAPGTAVNQFSRLNHRNEVYFSVFRPDESPKWNGNLKRYALAESGANFGKLVGQNVDLLAIDDNTGFFSEGVHSFWSDANNDIADGPDVSKGGAAAELPTSPANRTIYTYYNGASTLLNQNIFISTNSAITKSMLAISSESDDYREDLINWARGQDVLDADGDGSTTDQRNEWGDPLHSAPVAVTYGGTDADPDLTLYVGTNEGFIHAVDSRTGEEVFSFIPEDFYPNLNEFFQNNSSEIHPYGFDTSITAWVEDGGDGIIQPSNGDHVYLYIGMRRGGNKYYALDVTDRTSPKLMWIIDGSSGSYGDLGQSWSQPTLGKVQIESGGEVTDKVVLFIGGGYDVDQDEHLSRSTDDIGRAVFMVEAGYPSAGQAPSIIWKAGDGEGYDTDLEAMDYSIPAPIRLADVNGDSYIDQLYFGDMGGQVWRLDITNGAAVEDFARGGVIANLAGDDTANHRRFYSAADVVVLNNDGLRYIGIGIGSGWRAHPLDTANTDRFYLLKQPLAAPSEYTTLIEDDLFDASSNVIQTGSDSEQEVAIEELNNSDGWYITLPNTGEKVLAESLTVNAQVIFTTYEPSASSTATCSVSVGTGRTYVVSAFDATATVDMDGDDIPDRSVELLGGSIPPPPIALIPQEAPPTILVGPEMPAEGLEFGELTVPTYWVEE